MASIRDSSCVSSIIPCCEWMLVSARNSIETASSRSVSLVEASFTNLLAFEFLLRGMTSMKATKNKLSYSFAVSK